MESFGFVGTKAELKDNLLSRLSIEDRMRLDAGLIFTGLDDEGEPLFMGTDKEWKNYEILQENYNK